jgi:endo-1,4-beta-D-glucanase Y
MGPPTILPQAPSPHKSLFGLALLLLVFTTAACQERASLTALPQVLNASWESYRRHFITPEGRVVVPQRGGGTISEAQAYALLRAVWSGDSDTFARVYGWTRKNLSRCEKYGDCLLAWHWGPQPDGSWGVLDWNTAADADLDYALALALAQSRGWQPPPGLPGYLEEARRVMADILARETVTLPDGQLILTAGNWHETSPPYLMNPSYYSPAAFRLFNQVQPDPRWEQLLDYTYNILGSLGRRLGDLKGVGLFPDWVQVEASGKITPAPGRDFRFGWEAVRLPWRLALDHLWFNETRGLPALKKGFLPFMKKEWQAKGRLRAIYDYDGAPAAAYESPVIYAGALAASLTTDDHYFTRKMAEKILAAYRQKGDQAYFQEPEDYYTNNWAWLGLALFEGRARPFGLTDRRRRVD